MQVRAKEFCDQVNRTLGKEAYVSILLPGGHLSFHLLLLFCTQGEKRHRPDVHERMGLLELLDLLTNRIPVLLSNRSEEFLEAGLGANVKRVYLPFDLLTKLHESSPDICLKLLKILKLLIHCVRRLCSTDCHGDEKHKSMSAESSHH